MYKVFRCFLVLPVLLLASATELHAGVEDIDWDSTPLVRHHEFNAVDASGLFTFSGSFPLRLRGVLLNNPEDMLDATPYSPNPIPFSMGASWQVFVQSIEETDFGGTAAFLGQHYGNVPPNLDFSTMPPTPDTTRSYRDEEWNAEILRLNHDRETGHQFRAGDLVELRAQERRFFGGKLNVNENHIKEDIADFELVLITPGFGLPTLHELELADLWNESIDGVLFDPTRETGGEHYQGSLVRLLNVKLIDDPAAWGRDAVVQVVDSSGRQFPLKLGLREEFDTLPSPTGYFHVTGIFNQEDSDDSLYDSGYQLWVVDPSTITAALPGDYNADGVVDAADYTVWRNTLGSEDSLRADGNRDGVVDAADYDVWRDNFGGTLSAPAALSVARVPEPAGLVCATLLLGVGWGVAGWRGRFA